MDIFDRIVEQLETKGVSGAQMSRELGFSNAVFSQWKQRKQKPSADKVSKMAEYFGVSADYLLTGEDAQKKPAGLPADLHDELIAMYGEAKPFLDPDDIEDIQLFIKMKAERKKQKEKRNAEHARDD